MMEVQTMSTNSLRDYLVSNGYGSYDDDWTPFIAACSGDSIPVCDPATASAAATTSAWTKTIEVSLQTAAGKVHSWYNGGITLAIADSATGTASITSPTGAGTFNMTNGVLPVTIAGDASTWSAGATATLTVSMPSAQNGLIGGNTATATYVVTFA
jgi:hypothetical protein